MDVEALKKMDHKTKIRIGLIMGIFCALYWGVWYVPGYAVWYMPIMDLLPGNISEAGFGGDTATVTTAIFLTGMNAIFCALVLFIWNGAVIWSVGLPMMAANIAGNWLGSRLAIKVGTEAVRRFLWVSLSLLLATLIWRFFISPYLIGA